MLENYIDHFRFCSAAFYNDSGINLYSVSLNMKSGKWPKFLSKCQCCFTLPTTVCIVGDVTSRSLSQVFLNI